MQTTRQLYVLAFTTLWLGVEVGLYAQADFPESAVQIAAAAQGLTPLPSGAALPRWVTVWLIQPGFGGAVPMPGLPATPMPLFELPDGSVLADDTINQVLPGDAAKAQAILAAEASAVVNLVTRIQGAETLRETEAMLGITHPDAPSPSSFSYTINSNLLWLQITDVSGGKLYANLNQATNRVYTIFSATNLALPRSQWYNELLILPTNHQCMPFTLATAGRQDLFLLAEDCTSLYTNAGYLTNGLVAYWRLNDANGSIAVDQVAGNNLILKTTGTSLPTWGPGYLAFDGATEYCQASNSSALQITGDITICAWINSSNFPTSSTDDQVPVELGLTNISGAWHEGYFLRFSPSSTIEAGTWDGGAPSEVSVPNVNSTGQWNFLTATYDQTNWALYLNGIIDGTPQQGLYPPQSSGAPFFVGAMFIDGYGTYHPTNIARFFNGSIHDVGIYNRALSPDEVAANFMSTDFTNTMPIPELLYLKMLEGATNTTGPGPVSLVMADASTFDHTNVILTYPYTVEWVTNVAGVPNSALHYNGTASYIDTHDTNSFNFTTNPYTVNFWVLTLTGEKYIFSNGGFLNPGTTNAAMTNGWYIKVGGSESILFGSIQTATSGTYVATPNGSVSTTSWKMVTCVWDGINAYIYIDGAPVASGSFSDPASSNNSLVLGQDDDNANFYDGDMWLPQIWSSALTATDIANLYFAQSQGIIWP